MNDANVMANAYALYQQNLASSLGAVEKGGILDQLQTLLNSNGAANSTAFSDNSQAMDTSSDRDDGVRPACRFCGKTFAQASYIKAHERLHTGEKPYVCSVCNKAFSDASNWKKHERMHNRQVHNPFEDGISPIVTSAPTTPEPLTPMTPNSPNFSSLSNLSNLSMPQSLMSISQGLITSPHLTATPTSLSLSSQLTSFSAHLAQISAANSPSYTNAATSISNMFSDGPMAYTNSVNNASHLTNNSNINNHVNSNSSSSQSQAAAISLITRPPQNPSPSANSNLNFQQHSEEDSNSNDQDNSPPIKRNREREREREREESLNCNLCGKVFSTPASLSMHKKIHSGEKPHVCGTCGKAFTQIGTLRAHERVHSGEKPYECTFCGKTFAQCGSFRMHERRHHRDMMDNFQKCFVCGASFNNMEDLQKHMICHPGALNINFQNLQNLHPGALAGFPGGPMPMNFGLPHDLDTRSEGKASEAEMMEIEKAFNFYANQPKSAPPVSLADHFPLPPFASSAHALLQRSLSQGSDPSTAVSMFLASNSAEGMNLLNQAYSVSGMSGILSPVRLPPHAQNHHEPRAPSRSHDHKTEEVEPVSTTTRSRKYSSDSHTSQSIPDADQPSDNRPSQSEPTKVENGEEENENENGNDTDGNTQNQKTPSENSSIAESQSTEDFQSDEHQCGAKATSTGIHRRNLNRRMISSSNSRKQRRPMRRLSTSGGFDQLDYTPRFTEDGEEIIDEEKISKDQTMVSFLLSKGEVYKCEHCHIIFEDCTLYLLHNGFHANDNDPFKCVICKKSCDGRVEFNCHLTSHIK